MTFGFFLLRGGGGRYVFCSAPAGFSALGFGASTGVQEFNVFVSSRVSRDFGLWGLWFLGFRVSGFRVLITSRVVRSSLS